MMKVNALQVLLSCSLEKAIFTHAQRVSIYHAIGVHFCKFWSILISLVKIKPGKARRDWSEGWNTMPSRFYFVVASTKPLWYILLSLVDISTNAEDTGHYYDPIQTQQQNIFWNVVVIVNFAFLLLRPSKIVCQGQAGSVFEILTPKRNRHWVGLWW